MAVNNLGAEEGKTLTAIVGGTSAGTVLSMLEQEEEEGKSSRSGDWLSGVPHRMGDVELHHEEVAGHSEVVAHFQYMWVVVEEEVSPTVLTAN